MKKYFLVCNSHIDPVWMWDWEEGAATALSTFYQAAELLGEYDFVFCHNEALLYEFIEEYDPELFKKIQELAKQGKWKIMGGWYLQPDCNLPSGEALFRQIKLGREYFAEKFGARPSVALNFDSFGHSVGLVQILKKTGYDGYLCCRPMSWDKDMVKLPDTEFIWVGKDGSEVKAARVDDITLYCSGFGTAKPDIERKARIYKDKDKGLILWGVGNHGGNPSRKDLKDVSEMIAKREIAGEKADIIHACPEDFFNEITPYKSFNGSFQPCLIGCYAAISNIKKKNIELETALFETEKICSLAYLNGYIASYDNTAFTEAEKTLAKFQFHDLLAGTVCEQAEKSSLKMADHALEILKKQYDKAFFAYVAKSPKAAEGEFPIFVFNSEPYDRTAVIETEYLMPDSLVSDTEQYAVTVKQNGNVVKSQVIKEKVNINYDRRKRVAFIGELKAGEMNRFDISVTVAPKDKFVPRGGDLNFDDGLKKLQICADNGLIDRLFIGDELIVSRAFEPVMFDDYPDPWGWGMKKIGKNPTAFKLSSCKKGAFKGLRSVNVIEDGDVLTEVESLFENESSFVRMGYKIYKGMPYIDVTADVLWNENDKALKLKIPCALKGKFIGQIPYASDEFLKNGEEITAQRFVGVTDGENAMYIANDCVYSFSMDGDDMYITLLRGVAYCAHPIGDRPLLEKDRFIPFAETGKHTFSFRIGYCKLSEIENAAQEFVIRREGVNCFPHGNGETPIKFVLDNKSVSLSACYFEKDEYVLRLFNNNADCRKAKISCGDVTKEFNFGKYEAKTVVFDGKKFKGKELWI